MAVANRYTQLTPNIVNPMSMQEMMMVPMMKQRKQDEAMKTQDLIAKQLYNINRLGGDDEMTSGIVNSYRDKLSNLSDEIASNGISRTNMREFQNLYNNYQYDVSKEGKLGRIQDNYTKAMQQAEMAKKVALKNGLPLNKVQKVIDKALNGFSSYDSEGNYTQFGEINLPNNYDVIGDLQNVLRFAGETGITIGDASSDIQMDTTTGMYKVTNTKPGYETSNIAQVASLLNSYKQDFATGDKRDYLNLMEIGPDQFNEMVNSTARGMMSTKTQGPTTSYNWMYPPKGDKDGAKDKDVEEDPDNVLSSIGAMNNVFGNIDNKEDLEAKLNSLEQTNTPEAQAEYRRQKLYYDNIVSDATSNTAIGKGYMEFLNGKNGISKDVESEQGKRTNVVIGNGQQDVVVNNFTPEQLLDAVQYGSVGFKAPGTLYTVFNDDGTFDILRRNRGSADGKLAAGLPRELYDKASQGSQLKANYNDLINNRIKTFTSNQINYQLSNLKSADRTTIDKDLHDQLKTAKTNEFSITGGLMLNGDGTSKNVMDEYFDNENTSVENQKKFFNMIANPNSKVHFLNYTSENYTGNPSITLEVVPNEESDLHEDGRAYQLTVDLNNINTPGSPYTNSVDSYILKRFGDLGGTAGKALEFRGKQRIKYHNVEPTTNTDYSLSDEIKSHFSSNNVINEIVKDKPVNISMVGNTYQFTTQDSEGNSESIGWNNILNNLKGEDTLSKVKQLDQQLAYTLERDIKRVMNVSSLDELTEEQVNEALQTLADTNQAIIHNNMYDLMDIFSK